MSTSVIEIIRLLDCRCCLKYVRRNFIRNQSYLFRTELSRTRMSCSDRSTEISHDISDMRKPYVGDENPLLENDLPSRDPFEFFDKWFKVMLKTPGIGEPNAMAVATADKFGVPSLRMVLLKKYDKTGFCFFTNYESKKGKELDENPNAALLFYWDPLSRQVRIDGKVEKISDAESEDYFNRRPKKSQISATVSPQSQPVTLKSLEYKYDELMEKYDDVSVPRPKFWGGFKIIPKRFEFWQGTSHRLHHRLIFRHPKPDEVPDGEILYQGENGWVYERLGP